MDNKKYKIKLISLRNTISNKLNNQKININYNKNKNTKNSRPFAIKKNKFQNKTYFYQNDNSPYQKVSLISFQRKINYNPKIKHSNSEYFSSIQKTRSSSITKIKSPKDNFAQKFKDLFNNKIEKEINKIKDINSIDTIDNDIMDNITVDELKDKLNKEYKNMGKLIKMSFILDDKRIFDFEKNEYVILKIVKNDLKENQGLDVKDFILNNNKLDMFKSFKDNNIQDNSIIKVVI